MQQLVVVEERVSTPEDHSGAPTLEQGSTSFLLPVVFALSGQGLQQEQEERQLNQVIHQLFWNEEARRKLEADPDAFILGLEVLPQVKDVLFTLKATLLARRIVEPEFNWWWGKRAPDSPTGEPPVESDPVPLSLPSTLPQPLCALN